MVTEFKRADGSIGRIRPCSHCGGQLTSCGTHPRSWFCPVCDPSQPGSCDCGQDPAPPQQEGTIDAGKPVEQDVHYTSKDTGYSTGDPTALGVNQPVYQAPAAVSPRPRGCCAMETRRHRPWNTRAMVLSAVERLSTKEGNARVLLRTGEAVAERDAALALLSSLVAYLAAHGFTQAAVRGAVQRGRTWGNLESIRLAAAEGGARVGYRVTPRGKHWLGLYQTFRKGVSR